jgi:hypothetical protein
MLKKLPTIGSASITIDVFSLEIRTVLLRPQCSDFSTLPVIIGSGSDQSTTLQTIQTTVSYHFIHYRLSSGIHLA